MAIFWKGHGPEDTGAKQNYNICSVIHIPDTFIKEVDALFLSFSGEKEKEQKSANK